VAVTGPDDTAALAAADGAAVIIFDGVGANIKPYVTTIAAAKPAGSSQDKRNGGLSFTN
jgi:hypothetical protein